MKDVSGRLCFVTGGTSGIGRGITRALASAGATVIVTYLHEEEREASAAGFCDLPADSVHLMQLDVIDRAAVRNVSERVEADYGPLQILCNSAGVNLFGPMDEATFEDWDWILGVNLHGVINVLTCFLPLMKRHELGGHIINVGSMASFISGPGAGLYTTAKFAIRGLSECLRYTMARHGIGVSLVAPGLTRTNIHESARHRPARLAPSGFKTDPAALKRLAEVHALGMDPDEVGRKTLTAIRQNDFYVFPHPEFKAELSEEHAAMLSAFADEPVDAARLAVESRRRQAKAQAATAIAALRQRE